MATFTDHYNLIKPEEADLYSIDPWNENMDTLDGVMAAQEESIGEMNEKMGSAADTGTETIFGKLNQIQTNTAGDGGLTVIRSIQYKTLEHSISGGATDIAIDPVDTARTFVILERLWNPDELLGKVAYTLSADKIRVTPPPYNGILGFWIIEFM